MIIYKLIKSQKNRNNLTRQTKTDEANSMSAILISISIFFVVSQSPHTITTLIEKQMKYENYTQEYIYGFYIVETAFRLLLFVNNVAIFFYYCISGRRFRTELVTMVKECLRMKKTLRDSVESIDTVHWRIQGGAAGARPPNRINFFRFRIRFRQKVYASEVGAPQRVGAPPQQEILDPPLL